MLDYKGIVAVVSVIIYATFLPLIVYATIRKCFDARGLWLLLGVFAVLRILGDAFQLALEDDKNKSNKHLITGAAICNAIGLGPLMLASTRLLLKSNDSVHIGRVPNQTHRALVTFEFCTVVSTVITIVGGVQSFKPGNLAGGDFNSTTTLKVGVCLYAATLVCISSAAMLVFTRRPQPPITAKRSHFTLVTSTIFAAMPLLIVRVIYSLLSVFDKDPKFSPIGVGNETIQLCLGNLPEWLVMILYLFIAVLMRSAVPPQKQKLTGNEDSKGSKKFLRFVPLVHWFVR